MPITGHASSWYVYPQKYDTMSAFWTRHGSCGSRAALFVLFQNYKEATIAVANIMAIELCSWWVQFPRLFYLKFPVWKAWVVDYFRVVAVTEASHTVIVCYLARHWTNIRNQVSPICCPKIIFRMKCQHKILAMAWDSVGIRYFLLYFKRSLSKFDSWGYSFPTCSSCILAASRSPSWIPCILCRDSLSFVFSSSRASYTLERVTRV